MVTQQSKNVGRETQHLTNVCEYLVDSEADLTGLTDCAPGSFAYTANFGHIWQKDNAGVWQEI